MPGLPPLYRISTPFRGCVLATSPYLTDTPFPADIAWDRYIDACRSLREAHRARYLLLKTDRADLADQLGDGFVRELRYSKSVMDLSGGKDHVWTKVVPSRTRNKVRNGQKVGVDFKVGRHELLADYYRVIVATQTALGTPVHASRYFAAILDHNAGASLMVGYAEAEPVSVALVVVRDGTVYHPYTGTLDAHKPGRVNNALYWKIVEWGLEHGCHSFDMGRSIKGSGNETYKRTWGSREVQLYYCYLLGPRGQVPDYTSRTLKWATATWSRLPLALVRTLGPHFIRRVP